MKTNVVCSDTYMEAFSKLDKKTQKKALETIRIMQRSLKGNGLKTEKLHTKLNFKCARVTQDFRVIFTQSGDTVLLVYIARHDDAYLWASNKLQGFHAADAKAAYNYFEQSKTPVSDTDTTGSMLSDPNQAAIRPENNGSGTKPAPSAAAASAPAQTRSFNSNSSKTNQNAKPKDAMQIFLLSVIFLSGLFLGMALAAIYFFYAL